MATKEEILETKTYKDAPDLERRIFYTLDGEQNDPHRSELRITRTMKAVAFLYKTLVETGAITDEELDEILLEVVM